MMFGNKNVSGNKKGGHAAHPFTEATQSFEAAFYNMLICSLQDSRARAKYQDFRVFFAIRAAALGVVWSGLVQAAGGLGAVEVVCRGSLKACLSWSSARFR